MYTPTNISALSAITKPLHLALLAVSVVFSILPIASVTAAAKSDIAAIILPLSSTVWVPGEQGQITYRLAGSPGGQSFEIDLMSGDADNAQLVHVFETPATPKSSGINSVTVDVPKSIPEGKYGLRLGLADGTVWKYSQIFTVSKNGPVPSKATTKDNDNDKPEKSSSGASASKSSDDEDSSETDSDAVETPKDSVTHSNTQGMMTSGNEKGRPASRPVQVQSKSAADTLRLPVRGVLPMTAAVLAIALNGLLA
ncbi:hypothetical protein GGF37_002709 [Kickxella alabastrina]|nr:hypothetical protein GGF37_002709 [Kickxella alabastrina]